MKQPRGEKDDCEMTYYREPIKKITSFLFSGDEVGEEESLVNRKYLSLYSIANRTLGIFH